MKTVSTLASLASVLLVAQAHAFDPGTVSAAYSVVIAGASSPSGALRDILIRDVCDAGQPIDLLIHGGVTRHFNIACQVGGLNVLFRKNESGSAAGVIGVDSKTPQPFLNAGFAGCTASAAKTLGGKAYTERSNCGTTAAALVSLTPDFGLSDVEPAALKGPLAPTGSSFLNVSPLTVQPIASLALGFVATTDLYRALQATKFPSTSDCNPDPVGGTDLVRHNPANPASPISGANGIRDGYEAPLSNAVHPRHTVGDSLACMPILSRDEVRSMLARDLTSGNNIWVGPNAADTLTSRTAGKDYAGLGGAINLCRRNAGSGAHAVTSMHFLSTGCGTGSVNMTAGTCSGSSLCAVNSSESASGVDACLNAHATSNIWAVGYQSTEKNADLGASYRFVKIDGVAPTLKNLTEGNYGHFAELVAVRRSNVNDVINVPNIADIAKANANWSSIVTLMSTPANVGNIDALAITKQPFGDSGYAARGTPGFPPNPAAPINPLSHVRPGTSVQNTCAGPYATPVGSGTGKGIVAP